MNNKKEEIRDILAKKAQELCGEDINCLILVKDKDEEGFSVGYSNAPMSSFPEVLEMKFKADKGNNPTLEVREDKTQDYLSAILSELEIQTSILKSQRK